MALGVLFGGRGSVRQEGGYEVERPGKPVHLGSLLEACAILECKPEELFFNADADGSGCSTCGSDYPVLWIEVRR